MDRQQAARLNGAKSLGPITPEGKVASSRNALKHGILAKRLRISDEAHPDLEAIHAALVEAHGPISAAESHIAEEPAVCRFRLVLCYETKFELWNFTNQDGQALVPDSKIGSSAARIRTEMKDGIAELRLLQSTHSERKNEPERAVELEFAKRTHGEQLSFPARQEDESNLKNPEPAAELAQPVPPSGHESEKERTNLVPKSDTFASPPGTLLAPAEAP